MISKKIMYFMITGFSVISGCKGQVLKEETIIELVKCKPLNDSAISLINIQDYDKALEFINAAIECDSSNMVYMNTKGLILYNGKKYQECIQFIEKRKNQTPRSSFSAGLALCYFQLNDSAMFDSLKQESLFIAEQEFNMNKNETSLINYLFALKRFDGKKRMKKCYNSYKKLFTTRNIRATVLEELSNTPTLKLDKK